MANPETEPTAAIAICGGIVKAAVMVSKEKYYREAIEEWAGDPRVQEIVRVPVGVAREFLWEKWPGRDAAIEYTQAATRALSPNPRTQERP